MIVGFDSHFLGYRHAGYYLPDYLTVQFPEVQLASGMRVFAMRHRDTALEGELSTTIPIRTFILFPLPNGDSEYRDFIAVVLKRFCPRDLRVVARGGHRFVIAPVADLHILFPSTTRAGASLRMGSDSYTRHE